MYTNPDDPNQIHEPRESDHQKFETGIGPVKSIFPIKKPKKFFTKNIKVHLSETIQSYMIPAEAGRAIPKPTIIIVNPTLSRIPK